MNLVLKAVGNHSGGRVMRSDWHYIKDYSDGHRNELKNRKNNLILEKIILMEIDCQEVVVYGVFVCVFSFSVMSYSSQLREL